jgi:inositol transport system substrate-binding protein
MKKVVGLILVLLLGVSLIGGAFAQEETWLFGYANHKSDENSLVQMKAFCDAAVAWNEAGNTPKIETTTATAESDMQKQLADIDTMLAMGAKAIAIQGVDPVGIVPAVEVCLEQGVKVMEVRGANIDGILNLKIGDENVMGQNMYSYLAAQLDAKPELALNIGLMYGSAAQTAQLVRVDSCVALLKENYADRVTVLASMPCDWDTDKAQACMENWLQQYQGTMNCIISAAGMMATGACNAVIAAGESMDNWYFTTVDATEDALYSIKQGQVDMTVGIDCVAAGTDMFNYMVKYMKGEIDAGIYTDSPMTVIDSSNIDQWYVAK